MTSTIAGPYRTSESIIALVTFVLVMNAYDWPWAVAGTTAVMIPLAVEGTTLVVSNPLTKVTKKSPSKAPSTLNAKVMPSDVGSPCLVVRAGKALTGKAALVEGQDLIKGAAKL